MKRVLAVLLALPLVACVTRAVDEQLAAPPMSYDEASPAAPTRAYTAPLEASVGDPLPSVAQLAAADAGADASTDADAREASSAPPANDAAASDPDCVVDGRGYDCPTRAAFYACNGVDTTCVLGCAAGDVRCYDGCVLPAPDPSGCTLIR